MSTELGSEFTVVNLVVVFAEHPEIKSVVKSTVSSVGPSSEGNSFSLFLSDEGPTLETLDFTYPYQQYTNIFI